MHTAIRRTEIIELKAFDAVFGRYHNYKATDGKFNLQFMTHLKKGSEYLVVFFSSMMTPLPNPYYNRWSWAEHSTASCLYLHDCTSEEMCCWYLGNQKGDLFAEHANLVYLIAKHVGVAENNIILIGSSTGGYASLRMSSYFPRCTVYACNPQTILKNYNAWGVEALQRILGCEVDEIAHQDIIGTIHKESRIHYVQCTDDRQHFSNHYLPFRNRLSSYENISYQLVSDEGGHFFCPSAEDANNHFRSSGMDLGFKERS